MCLAAPRAAPSPRFAFAIAAMVTAGLFAGCSNPPSVFPQPTGPVSLPATLQADRLVMEYPASWRSLPIGGGSSRATRLGALVSFDPGTCTDACDPDSIPLPPSAAALTVTLVANVPLTPDTFVPTPGIAVAGMPAERVAGSTVGSGDDVTTWTLPAPEEFGAFYVLRARVRGPGAATLIEEVESIVNSAKLVPPMSDVTHLGAEAEVRIVATAIGSLAERSTAYDCFPREHGQAPGVVTMSPERAALSQPLDVTCRTSWTATKVGLLRLSLVMSWEAGTSRGAGEHETLVWLRADGAIAAVQNSGDVVPGSPGA